MRSLILLHSKLRKPFTCKVLSPQATQVTAYVVYSVYLVRFLLIHVLFHVYQLRFTTNVVNKA